MTFYNITDSQYTGNSRNIGSEDDSPSGLVFDNDGGRMYYSGEQNGSIYEYSLSATYDTGSASFVQSFSVSTEDDFPEGVTFNDTGSKMYVPGAGTSTIYEYDLSTAFDISTATLNQSFDASAQDAVPTEIEFNDTGSKMFVVGQNTDTVYEYSLSTNYDISTASLNDSLSIGSTVTLPQELTFNDDGTKAFFVQEGSGTIYEYDLSTAFDISTASFNQSKDASGQDTDYAAVIFDDNGSSMFTLGYDAVVYEYSIPANFSGTVTESGSAVQGAEIAAVNDTTDVIEDTSTTDSNGDYTLSVTGENNYHLTVQYEDGSGNTFNAVSKPYVTADQDRTGLDFELASYTAPTQNSTDFTLDSQPSSFPISTATATGNGTNTQTLIDTNVVVGNGSTATGTGGTTSISGFSTLEITGASAAGMGDTVFLSPDTPTTAAQADATGSTLSIAGSSTLNSLTASANADGGQLTLVLNIGIGASAEASASGSIVATDRLTGTVDVDGSTVSGVDVNVVDKTNSVLYEATTNSEGEWVVDTSSGSVYQVGYFYDDGSTFYADGEETDTT